MSTMTVPTLSLPTPEEARTMLRHPVVAATAIVCATLVVLAALGGIVYLTANGKGTEAVGALLLGLVGLVLGKVQAIKTQTNGAQSRLLDAAIGPGAAPNTGGPGGSGGSGGQGGQGGSAGGVAS